MRLPRINPTLSLLLLATWVLPTFAADPTPASVWLTDFAKAEAEARELNRPLVVHFHTKSCPPCRKMEKEVLHTLPVLKMLDQGFVAVKVDLDHAVSEKYQKRFRVESMPTDLILGLDGKVLYRSEGYEGGASGDRQKYVASITRIDAKFAVEGKRLARKSPESESGSRIAKDASNTGNSPVLAANNVPVGGKLVPEPIEPRILDEDVVGAVEQPATPPVTVAEQPVVGLDGYCPVTLRSTRTWKPGSTQYSLEHEGQTFLFLAAAKRDEFQANPARYAPRLLGCDPVKLVESDLAIRGSTKFGAYYEGSLFLFESADSRARFRKDPARYTHVKHVLKPEDIRKLASTAGK
jgi:YHS domain-containing protein/thiol-disulfide isomerase/thioredoxin